MRLDECLTQALAQCQARYPGRAECSWLSAMCPAQLDTPFAVAGNAQLLTTALLNLLDNACKYSRAEVRSHPGLPQRCYRGGGRGRYRHRHCARRFGPGV